MSGPKTSNYKLTPAQRRALIKQHETERRKGEARAHIAHLTAKIGGLAKLPAEYDEHSALLRERTGGDSGYSEKKQELSRLVEAELKALAEARNGKSPDVMEKAVKSARTALERLTKLRAELDAVYGDEQHPETVFTAENWQKVQDAYNTAIAAIDAAETSGAAGDAQQKAIQTIKGLQSRADSNNKANLAQFRRLLAQLPDDVTKLDAAATDTVAQLKTCYEAMTV